MITQMRSNVNEKIIEFIGNFYKSNDKSHEECEVIRKQFRNGYCYHFAVILRDLFPGGEMCIAAPFGHIVYVYENIPYDVEGVYDGEATDFIPISFLGDRITNFKHIPGEYVKETVDDVANTIKAYRKIINKNDDITVSDVIKLNKYQYK